MRTVIPLALVLSAAPVHLHAQQSVQAEARRLVGSVNIERAVVFNAGRASFQKTCNQTYRFEGLASVVGRLEYGALLLTEQVTFKAMLIEQTKSNNAIYAAAANETARQQFCAGLETMITDYVWTFAKAHPDLFTKKE